MIKRRRKDLSAAIPLNTPRILIVEDDAATRKLYTDVLQYAGHQTVAVAIGELEAELNRLTFVELLVGDIALSADDGGLPPSLRTSAGHDVRPKILAVSAHALPADRARFLDAGCAAYLAKPIKISEFLDCVAKLVGDGLDIESLE